MKAIKWLIPVVCAVTMTACAVRLGGSGPVEYSTLAVDFSSTTTPEQAAAMIRQNNARLVLMSTPRDTGWVSAVASASGLTSTRPGTVDNTTLAFLAWKPVGDTTHTVSVPGGGRIRLHDALYEIEKNRHIDLMTVVFDPNTNVREGVRALLGYIATDVSSNVPVVLAVYSPNTAVSDSVAAVTRAAWAVAADCSAKSSADGASRNMVMRLFYFPAARIRCLDARTIDAPGAPVAARLVAQ